MTEPWFRNVGTCIRECFERQVRDIVFDRGYLTKRGMDPTKFMDLYYGVFPYRLLIVGDSAQQTQELAPGYTMSKPAAQHPTWAYGEDWDRLKKIVFDPARGGFKAAPGYRTEPRVIITDLPDLHNGASQKFMRQLAKLQAENPYRIIHIHGLYSLKYAFGLGFAAADFDPRLHAEKGEVMLPNGKHVGYAQVKDTHIWVTLLGFSVRDLRIPRNRCMYNIESIRWAGRHFDDEIKFQTRRSEKELSIKELNMVYSPPRTNKSIITRRKQFQNGDKWLCDLCSLQDSCKYFRTGSVCAVPDSEPMELAKMFGSRDSEQIIDGLGALLSAQSRRLNRAMDEELDGDKAVNPEVTKMINTLFDRAVKLAKLLDPALASAGAPKVNVNFGNQIQATNPNQLMAKVYEELESRGIRRQDITPEMVERILKNPDDLRERAIEAAVSEKAAK
jgi:hypothetical protein